MINISVFSYRPVSQGSSTILYSISITTPTNITWVLEKRYSQFEQLEKELRPLFGDGLPQLPKKTYFSFLFSKTHDDIEERRQGLDSYLKDLVQRTEVFNSPLLRDFLEVDANFQDALINPPQLLHEVGEFLHSVRDFHIERDVMFIVNSDTNVFRRLDAYMSNMKMPWESEQEGSTQTVIPVGCVECWVNGESGAFERAWTKMYNSQAINLYWNASDCVLLVGLDSGNINLLRVPQLEYQFKRYEESTEIVQHIGRVMGVYYDPQFKSIHSISKDRHYKVLDLPKQILVADIEPGLFELTYLLVSESRKQSFIGDKCGSVFIYDISMLKPRYLLNLSSTVKSIRGMQLDPQQNFLFVLGHEEGEIVIFDVKKPGRESEAKEAARYKNKVMSREVCWSNRRGELYVGNEDGTVTIWDAKLNTPIYVFRAHAVTVTRMVWFEEDSTLITGGKDKFIKAWKMPSSWKDMKVEQKVKDQIEQNVWQQQEQKEENKLQEQRKQKKLQEYREQQQKEQQQELDKYEFDKQKTITVQTKKTIKVQTQQKQQQQRDDSDQEMSSWHQ